MTRRFPNLKGSTSFPDSNNVDVYEFANAFDYTRWIAGTKLTLSMVSWDNVSNGVWFSDDESRQRWLSSISGASVELTDTMNLKPDGSVKVPVPFDQASRYNYLIVEFPFATSPNDPIDYEGVGGVRTWCYFIDDVRQLAPSTSELTVTLDALATFSTRVSVANMILERGHWPVAQTDAVDYLDNPIRTNRYLTAPDVSFGAVSNVTASTDLILNSGEMLGVFVTTASMEASFGSKAQGDWTTPGLVFAHSDGSPGYNVFAIPESQIASFINRVAASYPQFAQTVQAFFLVSKSWVRLGSSVSFLDTTVQMVEPLSRTIALLDLNVDMFGYPERYKRLAKLYTYPYACLQVSDERGNVIMINVEDTAGELSARVVPSLMDPFVGFTAYLLGVGSATTRNVTFKNMREHAQQVGGSWYQTLMSWNVPTYAIVQGKSVHADWATYYDRKQGRLAYNNAYDQAETAANTAQTNANNSANTQVANTALATAANKAMTARSNQMASQITTIGMDQNDESAFIDDVLQTNVQEANAEAVAATTLTNAVGSTAMGAAQGAMTGGLAGAAIGAVGGIANGIVSGVNASIMLNATAEKVTYTVNNLYSKTSLTKNISSRMNSQQVNAATDNTNTSTNAMTGQTNNSAATAKTNAKNSRDTAVSNAQITADTAEAAIVAKMDQEKLMAPEIYAKATGDAIAVSMPMGLSVNVLTQSEGAIAQAADAFLRYGYALGQYVEPKSMQVMRHFTFWQAQDVTLVPLKGVTKDAIISIRECLANGIALWSDPNEIGKVSMYENI